MDTDISAVHQILIPLPGCPHLRDDEQLSSAISLWHRHCPEHEKCLYFNDIMLVCKNEKMVKQLHTTDILLLCSKSVPKQTASNFFFRDGKYFANNIRIKDEWLKQECSCQPTLKAGSKMTRKYHSHRDFRTSSTCLAHHAEERQEHFSGNRKQRASGITRMEDIFKILGECPPASTINRF